MTEVPVHDRKNPKQPYQYKFVNLVRGNLKLRRVKRPGP